MGPEDPTGQNQPPADDETRRTEQRRQSIRELSLLQGVERTDLASVVLEDLTDRDLEMYRLIVKEGTATRDQFKRYSAEFVDEEGNPLEGVSVSTAHFIRFLNNRINLILIRQGRRLREEQEEKRRREKE